MRVTAAIAIISTAGLWLPKPDGRCGRVLMR